MSDTTPAKLLICPYCGDPQPVTPDGPDRCRSCAGFFEPLSRQATHNAMGPWFVRDPRRPFQPGCSYETLVRLAQRGKVTKRSIVRGPTTRQFWTVAKRVPGIAHLLGYCHECNASVDPGDHGCHACGVTFGAFLDRNFLGLPEYRPLPWEVEEGRASHDDPLSRTWHGLPTIRDGGPHQGLSSFATDAELRGEVPISSFDVARPQAAAFPIPGAGAAGTGLDRNAEVTIRLLRRRNARQQRTIYRLTVLSSALALFALVAMIGWVAASLISVQPAHAPATQPPAAAALPGAADEVKAAVTDEAAASVDFEDGITEPPVLDEEAVGADRRAEIAAEFERASALLGAARDQERELAERIADAEVAVAILESIMERQPRRLWPAGIDALTEEARAKLDRLRLEELFP